MRGFRSRVILVALVAGLLPLGSAGAGMSCPQMTHTDSPEDGSLAWFHYTPSVGSPVWGKLQGPVQIERTGPILDGVPDPRGTVQAHFDTEILSMDLVSINPITVTPPGSIRINAPIHVVEDPAKQSTGKVPGFLDTNTCTFLAQGMSFFDVWFMVCPDAAGIPLSAGNGAACLLNAQAFRVQTNFFNALIPPDNNQRPYQHASGNPVDLKTAVQMTAAKADSGCHKPFFGGGPPTDSCTLVDGNGMGGVYRGGTFSLVAANVSKTAKITGVTMTSPSPPSCATVGTWSETQPDLWMAMVTTTGNCAGLYFANVVWSDGTTKTLFWFVDSRP